MRSVNSEVHAPGIDVISFYFALCGAQNSVKPAHSEIFSAKDSF